MSEPRVSSWQDVIRHRPAAATVAGFGMLAGVRFVSRELASWYGASELAASLQAKVAEQAALAEQLRWMATHDALTSLPNRALLDQRLRSLIAERDGVVAVLFIDLDGFKDVNDSLGHAAGDEVLRAAALRLASVVRASDFLARFGGDEFVVLVGGEGAEHPTALADRIRVALMEPFSVHGSELFITASIGVAAAEADGAGVDELFRDADAAMYRAKASGRNRVEVPVPGGHEAPVAHLHTTTDLRRGLAHGEFEPFFQPIVSLETDRVVGFEALARWRHPRWGLLAPHAFLPLAEEGGAIAPLGAAILDRSIAALARWRLDPATQPNLAMAVTATVRQLLDSDFPAMVAATLDAHGVPADALWLEITETALMTDVATAGRSLRALRALGVHLSVDDFGTGYASLTYLKRFPVEAVKVDGSFVAGLGSDSDDTAIVRAVIDLGHALGLHVIAEGVETLEQLQHLRRLGCDLAQGYLLGRPVPEAEARALPSALLDPIT